MRKVFCVTSEMFGGFEWERRLALACDLNSGDSIGGLAPANNVSSVDEGRILIIKSMEINGKTYEAGGLNILVGKNNSGKSTLLKELCATCLLYTSPSPRD